ncbi:hypothetical protein [Lysinibacillus cavernae]|uniref:hypothetical protein n=1 Tax=Lysinibacillus cavernae TaxID=2666135 RepID=UPI0018C33172|nr:hypothetical protein [Lysinibacillus cavernae]
MSDVQPLLILEYALLFGLSFLLIILQDFFTISQRTNLLLRILMLVVLLVLFITAIVYQAVMSIIFSIILLGASGFALYLHVKDDRKITGKQ